MVLVCVCLVMSDGEHLFRSVLDLYVFFETHLFKVFARF